MRSQALATATRFLPGHARRRHGVELEMGAWSEFLAAGEIRLRGRGDIGVVAWAPRYGLELDVCSGELELASAAGDVLVISAGKRRINALGAALRCVVDTDECRVTARAGVVETVSSTGGRRVLSLDAEEVLR